MKKVFRIIMLFVIVLGAGCQQADSADKPDDSQERTINGSAEAMPTGLPFNQYAEPNKNTIDYVNFDLSNRDLRHSLEVLLRVNFSSRTKWPQREFMPEEYDPDQVLEFGKNPGLGIRELHQEGITGRGVGIAIIDAPINREHQEYTHRLTAYESIGDAGDSSTMHGTAVASLAVGETVGTAPEAALYYLAASNTRVDNRGNPTIDYTDIAKAIRHILEINNTLPEGRKIRVISMSQAIRSDWADTSEVMEAVEDARRQGIFVLFSNLEDTYGFGFHGLGRRPIDDPDHLESFIPAVTQIEEYGGYFDQSIERLLVPMDARSRADHTDPAGYVFDRVGGRSWAIPYIAGIYALALQIDPTLSGERFWSTAVETGQSIAVETEEEIILIGPILNPRALFEAIREHREGNMMGLRSLNHPIRAGLSDDLRISVVPLIAIGVLK